MFIAVHAHNGKTEKFDPILVNTDHIEAVATDPHGRLSLVCPNGSCYHIKESLDEIKALIMI